MLSPRSQGPRRGRRLVGVAVVVALIAAAAPSPATAVTIGSDLTNPADAAYGNLGFYYQETAPTGSTTPLTAPASGVVVAIKLKAGNPFADVSTSDAPIKFLILNGPGPLGPFTIRPATPDGSTAEALRIPLGSQPAIWTYTPKDASGAPTGVPIAAGERIAPLISSCCFVEMFSTAAGGVLRSGLEGFEYQPGDIVTGGTTRNNRELLLQATIEPDADGDRYGDTTQDGCPTDAAVRTACPAAPAAPAAPTPPPKAPTPPAGPGADPTATLRAAVLANLPGSLPPPSGDALTVTLKNLVPGTSVSGTVEQTAPGAAAAAGRPVLARGSAIAGPKGTAQLRLKLTRRGREPLRARRRPPKARLVLRLAQPDGTRATVSRAIRLRARR